MNNQSSLQSLSIKQDALHYNTLIYGEPKTKKTTIALSTASIKPVLLLDCDGGSSITFTNPDLKAYSTNIFRINLVGGYIALSFMRRLFSGKPFYWNNTTQQFAPKETEGFIKIDLSELINWVIVFDSFTQYCSLLYKKYYQETNTTPNPEEVAKDKGERQEFYWTSQLSNDFLSNWSAIKADKILITHCIQVEVNEGATKRIHFYPASNTRNQSVAMGRSFNNVIACYKDYDKCIATTASDKFYQSGSSTSLPKKYLIDLSIDKSLIDSMISPEKSDVILASQASTQTQPIQSNSTTKPVLEIK